MLLLSSFHFISLCFLSTLVSIQPQCYVINQFLMNVSAIFDEIQKGDESFEVVIVV